jgi:hypothetical protein
MQTTRPLYWNGTGKPVAGAGVEFGGPHVLPDSRVVNTFYKSSCQEKHFGIDWKERIFLVVQP